MFKNSTKSADKKELQQHFEVLPCYLFSFTLATQRYYKGVSQTLLRINSSDNKMVTITPI